jgi:hypothetical protein
MPCNSCGLINHGKYLAEVDIHFPGLRNAGKSPVLVFPELLVCLDCGKTEFMVPRAELDILTNSDTTKLPNLVEAHQKLKAASTAARIETLARGHQCIRPLSWRAKSGGR